jgi:hypothetical protein
MGKQQRQQAHRSTEGPSQRQLRVAEEVRHALSALFTRGEFRPEVARDLAAKRDEDEEGGEA